MADYVTGVAIVGKSEGVIALGLSLGFCTSERSS